MEWKTSIGTVRDGTTLLRGEPLVNRAQRHGFVANAYFALTGKEATPPVEHLLNVLLSLSLEHGVGAVSTLSARIAASADVPLQQSLIAALAAMGHAHGGATEDAARWFLTAAAAGTSAADAVAAALARKERIPGYGHSIVTRDDRVAALFGEARTLGLFGAHCRFAEEAAREIERQKGKPIPLNIDGAIAALSLDLGLAPASATGLFILGRLPGLIAHIEEEREQRNGLRRLPEEAATYQPPRA